MHILSLSLVGRKKNLISQWHLSILGSNKVYLKTKEEKGRKSKILIFDFFKNDIY
jgi:hypothetical protein